MLTATRKPQKKQRFVTLGTMTNGRKVLWLTQDAKARAYTLGQVRPASGKGVAYRLGKADNGDGHMEEYTVYIDPHGKHCCDCAAHSFRNRCKHVDAIRALIAAGKLAGINQ